mmetsp:Transcript_18701/g.54493  ORF Transcript_18701/g.54493 Transcript_18701/m.54493 type:complete len:255 (+) Transcript_18701:238-1002(+)
MEGELVQLQCFLHLVPLPLLHGTESLAGHFEAELKLAIAHVLLEPGRVVLAKVFGGVDIQKLFVSSDGRKIFIVHVLFRLVLVLGGARRGHGLPPLAHRVIENLLQHATGTHFKVLPLQNLAAHIVHGNAVSGPRFVEQERHLSKVIPDVQYSELSCLLSFWVCSLHLYVPFFNDVELLALLSLATDAVTRLEVFKLQNSSDAGDHVIGETRHQRYLLEELVACQKLEVVLLPGCLLGSDFRGSSTICPCRAGC